MSKELQALERIKSHYKDKVCIDVLDDFDIIETALVEKEEIFENHNIKSFTELNERLCDYNELKFDDDIKQKKLKAFEIIKKKSVNIGLIKDKECTLEIYNTMMLLKEWQLTQEEYDLLREVLL